ncbi:hypothetical protein [Maricaulis maris]|uniref:CVNH domain-containing protein n=1 Tax=Maricaulis maris TaxID=74318 RepID=A0A495DEI5_9PROT|nr:hypothetical protein [Maricaulis maris]RKR00315.1 hypothetical protein C7435_1520 [Maricaulis maris]
MMRTLGHAARQALTISFGLVTIATAGAQEVTVPSGSWQQSCQIRGFDGPVLVAECRDLRGEMAYTRWDTRNGTPDLLNCNGELTARARCDGAPEMRAPGGSWRRDCAFTRFEGTTLVVGCYEQAGGSQYLRFDTRTWSGPLAICNGALMAGANCDSLAVPQSSSAITSTIGTGVKPGAPVSTSPGNRPPQPRPQTPNTPPRPPGSSTPVGASAFDGFPSGSWQASCSSPRWENRDLIALCRTDDGGIVRASFDTNLYFTTLSNCDGRLTAGTSCGNTSPAVANNPSPPTRSRPSPAPARQAPQQPGTRPFPDGVWRHTCHSPSWPQADRLQASCRTDSGSTRTVWVDLDGYTGRVTNCNGWLVAQSGCGVEPGLPAGQWSQYCADGQMDGRVFSAGCWIAGRPAYFERLSINLERYFGPVSLCHGQLRRGLDCPAGVTPHPPVRD